MSKTLLQAIGYRLGRKAGQARNFLELLGGTEEESLRAEIRLGRDMAAAVVERTPLIAENESTRFAVQVIEWLAARVKEKQLPFSLLVTAADETNAFALPGGPIFMSWPLLQMCEGRRDEIAFVLGHEMGHIVRRHTLDRIVQDAALALLLRQSSGRRAASAWLSKTGREVLGRAFSRAQELEADAFAVGLIQDSGGDPAGARRLMAKLAQFSAARHPALVDHYLATHPSPAERLARLSGTSAD